MSHAQRFGAVLLLGAFCGPAPAQVKTTETRMAEKRVQDFEARQYHDPAGRTMPYRLFKPAGYDPAKRYPLVIYLHGGGGSGLNNLNNITGNNSASLVFWTREDIQKEHPAFVMAPQANPPRDSGWVPYPVPRGYPGLHPVSIAAENRSRFDLDLVIEIIDKLREEFSMDASRLYVTGQSMGGYGAWAAIVRYPDKFAAAVSLCGAGDPMLANRIKTPIWAFNGAEDTTVPPARAREVVEIVRKAGGAVKYTEYPGVGHRVAERVYAEPGLAAWVFSQQR